MENSIRYTSEHPTDFNGLLALYESLGWNSLKLTVDELEQMCEQSWYAIYAFDDKKLVGMGRIISDWCNNRHYLWCLCIARVSVHWYWKRNSRTINPSLRTKQGYSSTYVVEKLQSYYESIGVSGISVGMKNIL